VSQSPDRAHASSAGSVLDQDGDAPDDSSYERGEQTLEQLGSRLLSVVCVLQLVPQASDDEADACDGCGDFGFRLGFEAITFDSQFLLIS
jgi:hypothetical protein